MEWLLPGIALDVWLIMRSFRRIVCRHDSTLYDRKAQAAEEHEVHEYIQASRCSKLNAITNCAQGRGKDNLQSIMISFNFEQLLIAF